MEIKKIGSNGQVRLNIDKLRGIEKELNIPYVTRLGIMGSDLARKKVVTNRRGERVKGKEDATMTNAEIGIVHEKGSLSRNIPRRSFLEVPIFLKSRQLFKDTQILLDNLVTQNLKKSYKALGIAGEKIVQEAFDTQGFGNWQKLKYRDGSPLIDSHQLRDSISSAVVTK